MIPHEAKFKQVQADAQMWAGMKPISDDNLRQNLQAWRDLLQSWRGHLSYDTKHHNLRVQKLDLQRINECRKKVAVFAMALEIRTGRPHWSNAA